MRCARLQNDADALKAARDFERAAKISFDLAQQQMQTGNANILLLLTAQQTYLQAVLQVVQARAARLSDTAALFQALGGGWWNREGLPTEWILNVGTGKAEYACRTASRDRQHRRGSFRNIEAGHVALTTPCGFVHHGKFSPLRTAMGHQRTSSDARVTSASPPIATEQRTSRLTDAVGGGDQDKLRT